VHVNGDMYRTLDLAAHALDTAALYADRNDEAELCRLLSENAQWLRTLQDTYRGDKVRISWKGVREWLRKTSRPR
jgi:hypothetical protein